MKLAKAIALTLIYSHSSSSQPLPQGIQNSKDFFILPAKSPLLRNTLPPIFPKNPATDCRAHIGQVLCLVDPVLPTDPGPRKCLKADLSTYSRSLENIYDALPIPLGEMFCKIDVIYVEKNFLGTAYAGTAENDPNKHIMGIRESALKENLSFSNWITWKEQLSFGGNSKNYQTRDDLVQVEARVSLENGASDFLYFVIAHEFGHLFDFAHRVNRFDCAHNRKASEPCKSSPNSWSSLSWESMNPDYESNAEDPWGLRAWNLNSLGQFLNRDELCFYACSVEHGSPNKMSELYKSLQESNLLTSYSSTNSYDDFAEGTAFWAISQKNSTYEIHLPIGERFNLLDKYLHSDAYQPKRVWIENFYSRF